MSKRFPEVQFNASYGDGSRGELEKVESGLRIHLTSGEVETFRSLSQMKRDGELERFIDLSSNGKVLSIDYPIRSFVNRDNGNLARPKPGELSKAAGFSVGKPLMLDHNLRSSAAQIGVQLDAKPSTYRGHESLEKRVSLREPEWQSKFLRGMLRTYSDHYTPGRDIECSICGSGPRDGVAYRKPFECDHEVGSEYGDEGVCHLLFSIVDAPEVSTTPGPAIKEARSLVATFSTSETEPVRPEEDDMASSKNDKTSGSAESMDYAEALAKKDQRIEEYSSQIAQRDEAIRKLEAERDEAVKVARKYARCFLEEKRLLCGQVSDERLEQAFSTWGVEGAVEFFEQTLTPNQSFSSQPAGALGESADSASSEDAQGASDGPSPTKGILSYSNERERAGGGSKKSLVEMAFGASN